MCRRSLVSVWMQWLSLCIFLLYLVRLRWVVCHTSRTDDAAATTTSDYALQIAGLDEEMEADDLLKQVTC
jgi:hypothetical protein